MGEFNAWAGVQPPKEGAPEPSPPRIILNPAGAGGKARHVRKLIETALDEGRAELVLTSGPGHAERLAREAASAGRDVIAVGGDGTVAEVANGMLASGQRVALGIVPCGTGNDYAFQAVRLPREPREALNIALTGTPRPFDVGQVNGRYFLNALGVGIDANIAAAAERLKSYPLMRGQTLYWAASLTELLFHYDRCPQLTVTVDDAPPLNRDFALAAVSIGPTYGGGFRINPDADPHDGLFDLCTLWKPSKLRALRLLPMIEKGRHLNEPEVTRTHVRHVTLEAATPIHAHLDGEVITASRFEARIVPGALLVRQ
jgi:diacylglycerol kinase (ATP)